MRTILVIVGAVVLVVGAVLLFVPIVPQASQKVSSNSASPYVLLSVSGFSLTGTIPVAVSWSANATVTVVAAACTSACNTGSVSGLSSLTIQTGRSGSFTLNQPDGGEVIFGIANANSTSPASATFNVTTAITTVGSILLIVGIVILIVGVVLKSKGKAMPAAQPMPAPPAETPAESTPDSMMGPPSP